MTDISRRIQSRLRADGDEKKARRLQHYVKHDNCSERTAIPQIRETLTEVVKVSPFASQPLETQIEILEDLF